MDRRLTAVIDRYFVKHHLHWTPPLIFIARQHTDARYWYSKSVCLSVRDVPVSDENGWTYRHSSFTIR